MLDRKKYAREWKTKNKWYADNFPGKLLTTNEYSDIGSQINRMMWNVFGIKLNFSAV